jgi:glucose-1-phosphate thymidylyltransferase
MCAKESLDGNVLVVFADTLFKADFVLDRSKEGIIWVQKVEDPRPFGVVKVNADNVITDFVGNRFNESEETHLRYECL